MELSRITYRVVVGRPEGKRPLGRPQCRMSFSRPVAGLAGEVAASDEYLARTTQALQLEAISIAETSQLSCMLVA